MFPKPGAAAKDLDSFRDIVLSSTLGKLAHRMNRRKAAPATDQLAMPSQCRGLQHRSTDMAAIHLRALLAIAKQRRRSCAFVFMDITAAFYRTIREGASTLPQSKQQWQ
eukprot:2761289-Alexandrium_andersonii.AAC.1